jgi:hypothetical protein
VVSSEKKKRQALFSYAAYIFICTYQRELEEGVGMEEVKTGAACEFLFEFRHATKNAKAKRTKPKQNVWDSSTGWEASPSYTTNAKRDGKQNRIDGLAAAYNVQSISKLIRYRTLFVDWQVPGVTA